MKNAVFKHLTLFLSFVCLLLLAACHTSKDTITSRSFQNLTARYNYIYNSNVILEKYYTDLARHYQASSGDILQVYPDPQPSPLTEIPDIKEDRQLDLTITKAQTIINEKNLSNYVDDAYILLGKANYLKGNYYVASEYFDYVAQNYKNNTQNNIDALSWKIRCLLQLNDLKKADSATTVVLTALEKSHEKFSEPLATIAQVRIYQKRHREAASLLESAIKNSGDKQNRIRWNYILAQLLEKENRYAEASQKYRITEKSNAAYELGFQARLNNIRLKALLNQNSQSPHKDLLALLKDDKNEEFKDQIYYQIGERYLDSGNFNEAERSYVLSAQNSTHNASQKGLSFLRIADINFKNLGNYVEAKMYYDSALTFLPKNYPEYEVIDKKSNNLTFLTERYLLISNEDTLLELAKLPEAERGEKMKALFNAAIVASSDKKQPPAAQNSSLPASLEFYFNNPQAITNGQADFKKKWGNRIWADNWRQSTLSSPVVLTANPGSSGKEQALTNSNLLNADIVPEENAIKNIVLPVTPAQLEESNQKIINAYFEIASFFQHELDDKAEAIETYEILLKRFPSNNHLAAIYYSLYLCYLNSDLGKSGDFKQRLLSLYPSSEFAKIINNPDYIRNENASQTTLNANYNHIFNLFEQKKYESVIEAAHNSRISYTENELAPQFAYLKAIAVGRTRKVDALISELKGIVTEYPNDQLITPLAKEHLDYIQANLADFSKRSVALVDYDPDEPKFAANPVVSAQPVKIPDVATPDGSTQLVTSPETAPASSKTSKTFTSTESNMYYYVIDVADVSISLSSSRFGIGQFNRGTYAGNNLRHQLLELDDDQLIFVGNFNDFKEAQTYANAIQPLLKNIMKVSPNAYTAFVVSKENFDKLISKDRIKEYLEFYKNNYR